MGNHPDVRFVEGQYKSQNCFVYIDRTLMEGQGCAQLDTFMTMTMKFAAAQGDQGLKKLRALHHPFVLHFRNQAHHVRMTDEIKILSSEARILCCRLLSDNGRETLMIGCHYLPHGLHKKNEATGLPRSITLTL